MKRILSVSCVFGFMLVCSALAAAPLAEWKQVKGDLEGHFAKNPKLKMVSIEKVGNAQYNTFTTRTGKYIIDADGKTVEVEKKEDKCVQVARVVFIDESKTKMTQLWSVIYELKNNKLVYAGFIPKEEVTEIAEARMLPSDDELKKIIIPAWNKSISGDDIELVEIKDIKVTSKYYTHSGQASKWIVTVDMVVLRKGGLLSGNKECAVGGTRFMLTKKQEADQWKIEFSSPVFRCDR